MLDQKIYFLDLFLKYMEFLGNFILQSLNYANLEFPILLKLKLTDLKH